MIDLVGAVPKKTCEDISSSCAALETKESLHPLSDGFGAVIDVVTNAMNAR